MFAVVLPRRDNRIVEYPADLLRIFIGYPRMRTTNFPYAVVHSRKHYHSCSFFCCPVTSTSATTTICHHHLPHNFRHHYDYNRFLLCHQQSLHLTEQFSSRFHFRFSFVFWSQSLLLHLLPSSQFRFYSVGSKVHSIWERRYG